MLRWRDPDGKSHSWAMPRHLLYGDGAALCGELADRGLAVAPSVKCRNFLRAYLAAARPNERVTCVNRTGWHEHEHGAVFVLPDRTIGESDDCKIVLQTGATIRSPFAARGSLEGWQEQIARPCEQNSRLAFAISSALAGALLWLTGAEGGGFHLMGNSSSGKTTALQVAASVWGRGDKSGFLKTWRGTANGIEGIAAMHSDAALVLDEIGQARAVDIAEACYMLAQGVGKTRANRHGEARNPANWRVMVLSSGELTIEAKITEDRGKRVTAGQMVRLIDLPADAGAGLGAFNSIPNEFAGPKEFADALKAAAGAAFGTAGPALVEVIAADPAAARVAVMGFAADWTREHCPSGADGQVKRAADRFALVAAAGEFAISIGILPWCPDSASKAAARMFFDWIGLRGGVGPAEISAGIAQVRRFIEAHGQSRFGPLVNLEGEHDRIIPNRAGFIRERERGREWLVLPEIWRAEIAAGHDPRLLAQALVDRGMMRVGNDGKPQIKTHIPALGKYRVYVLTEALLRDGDMVHDDDIT